MNGPIDTGDRSQYLTLTIADEQFAIPLLAAREIIRFDSATRVPYAPAWMHGVINLRGVVLAVVDLSVRFGLPPAVATPTTCVVIVELVQGDEAITLGVLADAVHEVVELRADQIQPTPSFGTRASAAFLRGVGVVNDRLTLLLEPNRILMDDEGRALRSLGEPEREGDPTGDQAPSSPAEFRAAGAPADTAVHNESNGKEPSI